MSRPPGRCFLEWSLRRGSSGLGRGLESPGSALGLISGCGSESRDAGAGGFDLGLVLLGARAALVYLKRRRGLLC